MGRLPSTVHRLPWETARWMLVVGLVVAVACGRSLGPDTDGDGLSDRQEVLFGTDPDRPDSDCDGLTDGVDTQPLTGAVLSLTRGPVTEDKSGTLCAQLEARLSVGGGGILEGKDIELSSDLGEFEPVVEEEPAVYRTTLCTEETGLAHIQASFDEPDDTCPAAVSQTVAVFIPKDELSRPGLNTFDKTGPIDGKIRVYALDGEQTGTLFDQGAYVLVEAADRTFSGLTNGNGFIEWEGEPDLMGPVDVTVTAGGYRTTSYFGVDAAIVAVSLVRLDPVPGVDDARMGTVEGTVFGFDGIEGLDPFPPSAGVLACDPGDEIPIAIVSIALRNVPLSSISMGNILEPPVEDAELPIPRPSNLVVHGSGYEGWDQFRLDGLPEGQHLLFALGGTVRCLLDVMVDPYKMPFKAYAMGIKRIQVKGGPEAQREDISLNIDLRPEPGTTLDVRLGSLPKDWKNDEPLPNGLVFGVMDTGGEGYIFVAVDGNRNLDDFVNPIAFRFPAADEHHIQALGIETTNLAVGFGGRGTVLGADPPGIATAITPGVKAGMTVNYDLSEAWLPVPEPMVPAPPQALELPLDVVSEEAFTGEIAWGQVTQPMNADLYVVRLNYMTPAPRNPLMQVATTGKYFSVGGPRSHVLWELFVPGDRTSIKLPVFPEDAPMKPVLRNPMPNPDDKEAQQKYGPDTLEIELNVYKLGAGGKDFDYNDDFEYFDVNLHAADVSQDSYLVDFSNYPSTP